MLALAWSPTIGLLKGLLHTVKLRKIQLQGHVGCPHPEHTGLLFAGLFNLGQLAPRRLHLDVEPDFVQTGLRGQCHLSVHFFAGYLIFLLFCFILHIGLRWLLFHLKLWRPRFA